jgi:hypothetical protein
MSSSLRLSEHIVDMGCACTLAALLLLFLPGNCSSATLAHSRWWIKLLIVLMECRLAEADGPLPDITYQQFVPMFKSLLAKVRPYQCATSFCRPPPPATLPISHACVQHRPAGL